MEKIDFIQELFALADDSQKRKIIDLSMKEFESTDELSLRLDGLESLLSDLRNNADGTIYGIQSETEATLLESDVSSEHDLSPHDPRSSNKFLSSFSRDDEFKFFTHVKEEFSYQDLMASAKKLNHRTWELLESKKLNKVTRRKILNFCAAGKTGKEFWTDFQGTKCEQNWKSVDRWCSENVGEYPKRAGINKGTIVFDEIITRFKKTIQIRNNFKYLIFHALHRSEIVLPDFKVKVDITENEFKKVNLYIDVHLLLLAIRQMLDWIKERKAQSNEITISIKNDKLGEFWDLRICHVGSELQLDPGHAKFTNPSGDLATVKEQLRHVADWKIETKVTDDESYHIVLLPEVAQANIVSKSETPAIGFTHVLRLYEDR
ncbi:hypothetical protein N9C70_03045 [Flavobacteriales bacterium]|nr:hypothetical protein [Flavobacteriales bacterium]